MLAAAQHAPVLACVDDAQWADRETLRFLSYLAGRLREASVLLVTALRPREAVSANDVLDVLATGAEATVLRLSPLSEPAIGTMISRELTPSRTPVAPEFVAACQSTTGGNPFLLCELLRTARAERLAPTTENAEWIAGFVPAGVSRAVLARLARLPAQARRVGAALAVLGGDADWRQLTALSELPGHEVAGAVDLLAAADVLARSPTPQFLHPIVREAIYDDLALSERDSMHRRAARLLADAAPADIEAVAAHLMSTRPRAEAWTATVLAAAAAHALAHAAPDAATHYLRRALSEPPPEPAVANVLRLLGQAQRGSGNPPGAAAALTEALGRSQDVGTRGEIVHDLAHALAGSDRTARQPRC